MISIKASALRSAALTVGLAAMVSWQPAFADNSMQFVQYNEHEQTTIYCAVGSLCEVTLHGGEKLVGLWTSAPQWQPSNGVAGDTPVLTVKPETDTVNGKPLTANFVLTTNTGRQYHLKFISYNPDKSRHQYPLYTYFAYDIEARAIAARDAAKDRANHQKLNAARSTTAQPKNSSVVTPAELTMAQVMDQVCQKMPASEQYGIDPVDPRDDRRASFDPQATTARNGRSVCHSFDQTYIQMPVTSTQPNDLPTILEYSNDGPRIVNSTYDAPSRIFRIDDVANEYTLVLGSGKTAPSIKIQRQVRPDSSATAAATGKNK